MKKIWRYIFGTNEYYEISNDCEVRSYYLRGSRVRNKTTIPRIVPHAIATTGYDSIQIVRDGKYRTVATHILLVETFILGKRIPRGLEVRHLDGNRLNNDLSNLSVGTRSDNNKDILRYKLKHLGWSPEQIHKLKAQGWSYRKIGRRFGVQHQTVKRTMGYSFNIGSIVEGIR